VQNKGDKQRLEAAQMRFLRLLLGYTKKTAKKCGFKGKTESTNHSTRNSELPEELETGRRKVTEMRVYQS
jgi:hypothetical protein